MTSIAFLLLHCITVTPLLYSNHYITVYALHNSDCTTSRCSQAAGDQTKHIDKPLPKGSTHRTCLAQTTTQAAVSCGVESPGTSQSPLGQDATQSCLSGSTSEQFNNLERHLFLLHHKINFRHKFSPGTLERRPALVYFGSCAVFPNGFSIPNPGGVKGGGGVTLVPALSVPPQGAVVHSCPRGPA